jgi:hypothetical protein
LDGEGLPSRLSRSSSDLNVPVSCIFSKRTIRRYSPSCGPSCPRHRWTIRKGSAPKPNGDLLKSTRVGPKAPLLLYPVEGESGSDPHRQSSIRVRLDERREQKAHRAPRRRDVLPSVERTSSRSAGVPQDQPYFASQPAAAEQKSHAKPCQENGRCRATLIDRR